MSAVSEQKRTHSRKQSKKNKRKKTQNQRKERALYQVRELHELLLQTPDMNLKRAYIKHMRALAEKVQLKLPFTLKNAFCSRCSEPFTIEPEKTYTVRLQSKPEPMIVYTCLKCGYKRKKLYSKRKEGKRKEKEYKKEETLKNKLNYTSEMS